MEPGALPSGLVAGYEIIHDELGLDEMIDKCAREIAGSEYIMQKVKGESAYHSSPKPSSDHHPRTEEAT